MKQMIVFASCILHMKQKLYSPTSFSNHVVMEHETDNPVNRCGQGDEEWKRPFS